MEQNSPHPACTNVQKYLQESGGGGWAEPPRGSGLPRVGESLAGGPSGKAGPFQEPRSMICRRL